MRPIRPFNAWLLGIAYGALLVALILLLTRSIVEGGNPWQQGDWLINFGAGIVRRGLGGYLIVGLADALGMNPMHLLAVIQGSLTVVIVLTIARATVSAGLPDRLILLLVSPAFIPFWAYDFLGAMRKEMVAILAFLPLLRSHSPTVFSPWRGLVSLAIFALAVSLHEANGFLAPFLALALWIAIPVQAWRVAAVTAAIAIAIAGFGFALRFATVNDVSLICDTLTDRGIRPGLCSGAIEWLAFDVERVLLEGRVRLETSGFPVTALVSYGLALVPFGFALLRAPSRLLGMTAILGSALLFAPLYVVALDWGRWVFLHIAALTLVFIALANHREVPWLTTPLKPTRYAMALAASALWSMNFFTAEIQPGLVMIALDALGGILGFAP